MKRAMPRVTITLPAEFIEELRTRTDRGTLSGWIAQAIAERLARERLTEAIAEYEQENGPITDQDIATARTRTAWSPPDERRRPAAA
jgi:hypothetical protein